MITSTSTVNVFEYEPLAVSIGVPDRSKFTVKLVDGRELSVPTCWFQRLANASLEDLRKCELIADGVGITWPALDEDLSIAGLLRGTH